MVSVWASAVRAGSRTSSRSIRLQAQVLASGSPGGADPRHATMTSQLHLIEDRSQVGSVRRAASQLAASLGFSAAESGKVALASTEIATNIIKHAGTGRLVLRALEHNGVAGIEMLGLDRGPGIENLTASLRDGESTAGSSGHGLGAL